VHSRLMDGGCGTSMFCKECGAAKAVKKTNDTRQNSQEECKITAIQNNKEISFEYLVNTQPIVFKNSEFTLFSVKDISSIKRKEALERIFFHDILNTGGAIHGIAQLLSTANNEAERKEYIDSLISSSAQLLDEIQNQRELQNAEEGNLITSIQTVSANQILETAFKLYNKNELNAGRILTVTYLDEDVYFKTDRTLLVRSIGNLIKNALEASSDGEMVKIYSFVTDENVFFNVYNQQLIPENVQLQLFKRSFSTKPNKGRGIGLYSVKLIIEQYLKGKVSFVSSPEIGTVFTLDMPKN
jgi:signal transduction histidine kinase